MNYSHQTRAILAGILAIAALGSASAGTANDAAHFERFSYDGRSQEAIQPGPGEFRNPILSGYYPDPSIVRAGEDYYLINSSFTNFPGIPVFHSRDMVSWKQIGNAVDRPGQFNFKGLTSSRGIYAPDISYHGGLFYIVTTCVDCGGNIVMTAANPAGPWSDPKPLKFNGIDPSIFWDTDGKAYIVNNDAPNETPRYDGHRAIWIQEFDPKTLAMTGERTQIVNGGVDLAAKPIWIEGPHLLKRGGYYYLSAAEGGTGDQHSQVVFRSRSLRGPFQPFAQNPILSQRSLDPKRGNPVTSAGHAKFVQTQNGEWWATFLATRPYGEGQYNIGRETFLLPVSWKDDWPMVLEAGKRIPFTLPKPKLPAQSRPASPMSGDFAYADEFTGPALSDQWIGVRTPAVPFQRIENGQLLLTSSGLLGDLKSTPAFIGRRQQHHVAKVETSLNFHPGSDGDRAGLVAYQSDRSHLFFGLTRIGGKNVVALYTRAKADADVLLASAPADSDDLTLSIQADGGRMKFMYKAGGEIKTLADDVDATFLSTHKAGGFVGTIIGPYVWRANLAPQARGIDTLLSPEIGGIKQFVKIKTDDARKPALLFLSGGPGSSLMKNEESFTNLLKEKFTIVQWDQRNAGKTLKLNPSPTRPTVEQMGNDTHQVIEFVRRELNQEKIYLLGSSWGNVLGFHIVKNYPQLLHSYFAVNPVISQLASEKELLTTLKSHFRDNPIAGEELARVAIPFKGDEDLFYLRKWLFYKEGKDFVTGADFKKGFLEWSTAWSPVWNEVMRIDLTKTLKKVECPVYFLVGKNDIQTLTKITQEYFEDLQAPKKNLFLFEQSAHQIHQDEPEKFQNTIIKTLNATGFGAGH